MLLQQAREVAAVVEALVGRDRTRAASGPPEIPPVSLAVVAVLEPVGHHEVEVLVGHRRPQRSAGRRTRQRRRGPWVRPGARCWAARRPARPAASWPRPRRRWRSTRWWRYGVGACRLLCAEGAGEATPIERTPRLNRLSRIGRPDASDFFGCRPGDFAGPPEEPDLAVCCGRRFDSVTPRLGRPKTWCAPLALVLLAVLLAVTACSMPAAAPPESPTSPSTPAVDGPVPIGPYAYADSPCPDPVWKGLPELKLGPEYTCGRLTVPENRVKPEGKQISIPVTRLKSSSPNPKPEPLLMLTGGPGGSGFLSAVTEYTDARLNRDRDVIFIDQRGTLNADPFLDCREIDAFTTEAVGLLTAGAETEEKDLASVEACRNRWTGAGVDLAMFDTAENSRRPGRPPAGPQDRRLARLRRLVRDRPDPAVSAELSRGHPQRGAGLDRPAQHGPGEELLGQRRGWISRRWPPPARPNRRARR